MRRRKFIKLIGGAAVALPLVARAQPARPVVGFIRDGLADASVRLAAAFRKGLKAGGVASPVASLLCPRHSSSQRWV
jgi:putative tryptophan/tyrosine transport system substrate-binding protein